MGLLPRVLTQLLLIIPALLALASVLAPILEVASGVPIAAPLYFLLSYFCPQIPSHALWLYGAPTGVSTRSIFLYLAFAGTAVFMLQRRRFLLWKASFLLILPILLDVLTQMAGWRTTNNSLRAVTGALSGMGLAGLVVPIWAKLVLRGRDANLLFPALLNQATFGLLLLAFIGAILPYGIATGQTKTTIPEGTRVAIKTVETLSSETAKKGQVVHFEVVRDVEIQGKIVIKAGSQAVGEVTRAASKRMLGREGELDLIVRYVTAVDGSQVSLRASLGEKGEEKLTTAVVLGVVLCPLFLMMKGEEAVVPSGTEYTVFVDRATAVAVD